MEPLKDTLEEAYWLALMQDEEAVDGPLPANGRGRSPVGEAGSTARPIDMLWASAQRACDADEALSVEVTGFNRGGLLVDWQGLHGFVPSSHLIGMPAVNDEEQRKTEFSKRVGQHVHGKIIELDRARGRWVLAARLA